MASSDDDEARGAAAASEADREREAEAADALAALEGATPRTPRGDAPLSDEPGRSRGGTGGRRMWSRIGVGLAGIALAGATVWGVEAVSFPEYGASPSALVLSPTPGDQQRVCPGPLTLLGQSSSDPTAAGYKGYAEVVTAGDTDDLEVAGLDPVADTPATSADPADDAIGVPAYYQAPGTVGGTATSLAVSQTIAVASPGAAGFAATNCAPASADQWLVGGATTGGSSTVLTVANPTDAAAVVRVDLHGIDGALPTAGLDGLEVPAGSQVAVSLEGIAPDQSAFVAHIVSRGSVVGAALNIVGLEGLQAQGVEVVGPSPSPSTRLDIVGVPVTSTPGDGDEAAQPTRGTSVRVFEPGDEVANVTITVRDAAGVALEPTTVTIPAGTVSDVSLAGVPSGRYSVTVESDTPIVGAVRSALTSDPFDFAWYQASPPLDGSTSLAVAPGPQPRLHLATTNPNPVTVTLEHPDGDTERLVLQPGRTTSVDVSSGAYRIDGMLQTVAQVTYDGPGQMAGVAVTGGSPLAADVTVYR
ncbi:MAG: DUF5719 family protein [Pseudoclavibacter sp.]